MRRLAFSLLLAAGCASVPTAGAEEPPAPETAAPGCDAARARHLIGRAQSEETAAEALRLTGARALRWLPPGTMVTMDYRPDRLNIDLDGSGKIINLRCG